MFELQTMYAITQRDESVRPDFISKQGRKTVLHS
jgi:hypothetical protein